MQSLIILRGPMGSGKTTIANHFRSFEKKMAVLHVDDFKNTFDHFEKGARPVVYNLVLASFERLVHQGFSVIIEGVLQDPQVIELAVQIAHENRVKWKIFELTAAPAVLEKRDLSRQEIKTGQRQPLGRVAIESMLQKLKKKPVKNSVQVNTDNLSLDEVIKLLEKELGRL